MMRGLQLASPSSFTHNRQMARPKKPDPVTSKGVPLRASEWDELNAIARRQGATLASLLSVFVRHGRDEMKAGRLKIKTDGKRFVAGEDEPAEDKTG